MEEAGIMTTPTCPYCQSVMHLRGGQFPPHFAGRKTMCPVQWMPPGWRTTLRAAVRGLIDIVRGR